MSDERGLLLLRGDVEPVDVVLLLGLMEAALALRARPQAVLDAASRAIVDCDTRYTAVTGTADLREAIAEDLKRRKNLEYNPAQASREGGKQGGS